VLEKFLALLLVLFPLSVMSASSSGKPQPPWVRLEVQSLSPSVETSTIWPVLEFIAENGKKRAFWKVTTAEVSTFRIEATFEFRSLSSLEDFELNLHALQLQIGGRSSFKIQAERGVDQPCTKVWIDDDAVFESKSIFNNISFSRAKKEIRLQLKSGHLGNKQPQEKTKVLESKDFQDLDQFLSGLCLVQVKNEPIPPPGGPADITIKGRTQHFRLGWWGNTGGDYYLLTGEMLTPLFEKLQKYGPQF
jgi:hypothetical protein